jgi:hypothetical protein
VKANQIHSPTLSFDGDAVVKRMAASPAMVPRDQQNQHHKVGGVGHGHGRFSSPALDVNSPRYHHQTASGFSVLDFAPRQIEGVSPM